MKQRCRSCSSAWSRPRQPAQPSHRCLPYHFNVSTVLTKWIIEGFGVSLGLLQDLVPPHCVSPAGPASQQLPACCCHTRVQSSCRLCAHAQAQLPKQDAQELAVLREQLGELAALAHASAKVEGLPVPQGDAQPSQQVAATLRTLLQVCLSPCQISSAGSIALRGLHDNWLTGASAGTEHDCSSSGGAPQQSVLSGSATHCLTHAICARGSLPCRHATSAWQMRRWTCATSCSSEMLHLSACEASSHPWSLRHAMRRHGDLQSVGYAEQDCFCNCT